MIASGQAVSIFIGRQMNRILRPGALLIAASLTACGGESGRRAERTDVVHQQGGMVAPELTTASEWSFGGEAADVYSTQFAQTRSGHLVLMNRREGRITVFGVDGKRVAAMGRPGSGPGELGAARSFGTVGDSIWVFDAAGSRLTIFSLAGEVEGTRHVRFGMGNPFERGSHLVITNLSVRAMYPDGDLLVHAWSGNFLSRESPRGALFRISAGGWIRHRVAESPIPGPDEIIGTTDARGNRSGVPVPFTQGPAQGISPTGSHVGQHRLLRDRDGNGLVDVVLVDASGDTLARRELFFPADRIPERLRDSVIHATMRWADHMGGTVSAAARSELRTRTPRAYDPVVNMRVGRDTTIGLLLHSQDGMSRLLLLDRYLAPIGMARFSDSLSVVAISRDRIITVGEDVNGFQTYQSLAVKRPPA